MPTYTATYKQVFSFDDEGLGRMMSKDSSASVSPNKVVGDDLNYTLDYVYDDNYAHRLVRAGKRYYDYDANGNVISEHEYEADEESTTVYKIKNESDSVYGIDYGWGLSSSTKTSSKVSSNLYNREYQWNERNLMISSVDSSASVTYGYGADGQRAFKYTSSSETLYFNTMWSWHYDSKYSTAEQVSKNIYLGETRIVTKLNRDKNASIPYEQENIYYYHADHLGSAQLITDYQGEEYQRLEYTPYGEIWIEKTNNSGSKYLPYKFTGKEMDEETGLYYYGARYLDPKYSRWLSTDPALSDYIPAAGKATSEEAGKLSGMGGLFNHINGNLYHYAGNNPVRYTDPDGRLTITSYYVKDFLAFQKSTKDMLAIPIGGGLTDVQKDITKLSSAVNLAMGFIPTVGPYAGVFSSDFSLSTLKDTVSSIAGMVSDAAGSLLSVTDFAQLINSNPDISANNYTSSQKEYLTMCGIEQAFVKDLSDALNSNGIFNELNTEKGSSFIKNIHILATDVYAPSEQIKNIAEQVKSTNPLYENIKID